MATGQEQLTDLQYREKIRAMPDRELLEYVAVEQYYIKLNCAKACDPAGTSKSQKAFNYTGLAGFAAAVIIAIWEYFNRS